MFSCCIFHAVSFWLSLPNSLLQRGWHRVMRICVPHHRPTWCLLGYAPAIVKWDNTCHSQHHGTEPPVHFCCSHYILYVFNVFFLSSFISPSLSLSRFLSLPPSLPPSLSLSLSLSLPPFLSIYVSLWLQDTCHMMPCTKQHSAYAWVVTCILFLIKLTFHNLSLHSSYRIRQPFTDYFFTTAILRATWKTSFSLSGQPPSSFMPDCPQSLFVGCMSTLFSKNIRRNMGMGQNWVPLKIDGEY